MMGSMLGDFVKGHPDRRFSQDVVHAIRTHRAVDTFTDGHEIVRKSKRLISPDRRRFAGIIIDIFYDFYLCRHWPRFSDEPLDNFIQRAYANLQHFDGYLPARIKAIIHRMVQADWLSRYQTRAGIATTLDRVARRIQRKNSISGAIEEMTEHYDAFNDHFLAFFPELISRINGR
jgi:acyl carrier protein phosphodiesterase